MAKVRIPVISIRQNSTEFYIGKVKARDLHQYTVVDRFNSELGVDHPSQGYQRPADSARFKRFANYLLQEEHPLCPTAILLSSRQAPLSYESATSSIELNTEHLMQIVDGQHRVEGYRFAVYEKQVSELADFEVPVIIVPELKKVREMKQFEVINSQQKSVRTDLVNMILTQVAKQQGESTLDAKQMSRVVITRVVESLNGRPDSPWHNLIVMPDEKSYSRAEIIANPELANLKIVRATSFMTSLKPIYDYLQTVKPGTGDSKSKADFIAEIMIGYWSALKFLMPAAFASPNEYVIQKTPGLFSLHTVCRLAMTRLIQGGRTWARQEFESYLSVAPSLTTSDTWLASSGDAAKYGSMKGFGELADSIMTELERGYIAIA